LIAAAPVIALVATLIFRWWPSDTAPGVVSATGKPKGEKAVAKENGRSTAEKNDSGDFLGEFSSKDSADKDPDTPVLSNAELERHLQILVAVNDKLSALKKQAALPGGLPSDLALKSAEATAKALMEQFDRHAITLDKELHRARKARPDDPLVRWLTGETLLLVGGEPEELLPHLEYALKQGLNRPRLRPSIALAHLRANQFSEAYRTAEDALDRARQDRYAWNVFGQVAISSNRFQEVRDWLTRAFPDAPPDWAKFIRKGADELRAAWEAEEKVRQAEARADDLPRVRLVVEHRRFARDAAGKPLTEIETTGRGEVILELFENEAPRTVANFIELVSRGFYDGTCFHLSVPGIMVTGGDPNTRDSDPQMHGLGGPGYTIRDESDSPRARGHFRGSVSMVANPGQPHRSGSQFFLCLAPAPEANGMHTVFGRVIEGQDVVDRITRGRTTRKTGPFGRLIPGDRLVRAEVLRKRPHDYRAVKD
jgi:cyclophilin family peptidyl-prolyl cis-trans isomerase